MTGISVIGYIAWFLTTMAFIPQAYKTVRTRSARDLSFTTFAMFFAGAILWFIYGYSIQDNYLQIAYGITAVLTGIIFIMKIISGKHGKH